MTTPQAHKDIQLIEKSLEGDMEAFAVLVETYEGRLLRYIMRISSHDMDDAEEVLQEVFINCWKNLHGYDSKMAFSTWVYRIAHNTAISAYRKQQTRGEDVAVRFDPELYDIPSEELSIGDQRDQALSAQTIAQVLAQLKPIHKEILVLRYFEELSYEEISDVLKKSGGTVATLLSRAKKEFEVQYTKHTLSYNTL